MTTLHYGEHRAVPRTSDEIRFRSTYGITIKELADQLDVPLIGS